MAVVLAERLLSRYELAGRFECVVEEAPGRPRPRYEFVHGEIENHDPGTGA